MKENLLLALLAILCLATAAFPAGAGTADDSHARVATILDKVKPFDAASRDAAVEELTAGGTAFVPAIREALVKAEDTRRETLDMALVRITWKGDPGKRVAEEVAKQAGGPASGRIPPPVHVSSSALDSLAPDRIFYSVIFRQYPVAMMPPSPLKPQMVAVHEKDGTVKIFTSVELLKVYFMRTAGMIRVQGEATKVAGAWLRLTQEFSQDGFFRFTVPEDQIKSTWQESGGLVVTGKAVVVPKGGDSGEIVATLTFAGQGNNPRRLVTITEARNVRAGIRPICQATKLLDSDPIVRRMAEQDILVMGRASWPYIAEQREKASAELRREIDRVWKRVVAEGR